MFVQLIKGKVADGEGLRRQDEGWRTDVRPGAVGFLGSTVGITDDGTFVAIARFEDEAAARKNGDRPEQQSWRNERSKCFAGEPTFRESSDVSMLFDGGSDDAGFVQLIESKV